MLSLALAASACSGPDTKAETLAPASAQSTAASYIAQKVLEKALGWGVSFGLDELVGTDGAVTLSQNSLDEIEGIVSDANAKQTLSEAMEASKGLLLHASEYVRDSNAPTSSYSETASALDSVDSNLTLLGSEGAGGAQMYQLVAAVRTTYLMEKAMLARKYLWEGQASATYLQDHRLARCNDAIMDVAKLNEFVTDAAEYVDGVFPAVGTKIKNGNPWNHMHGYYEEPSVDSAGNVTGWTKVLTPDGRKCYNTPCSNGEGPSKSELLAEADAMRELSMRRYLDDYGRSLVLGAEFDDNILYSALVAAITCKAVSDDSKLVLAVDASEVESPAVTVPKPSSSCGTLDEKEGLTIGQSLASCSGEFELRFETDGTLAVWQLADDGTRTLTSSWDVNGSTEGIPYSAIVSNVTNLKVYDVYGKQTWRSWPDGDEFDGQVTLTDAGELEGAGGKKIDLSDL